MSDGNMDVDESPVSWKVKSLEKLIDGSSFSSTLSRLSSSSRLIPTSRDFHFYYNFDEFKRPIDEITGTSQSTLATIGDSEQVWGKSMKFPGDVDDVYAEDWLCNVNDELIERFDVSVDEFQRIRKKEKESGSVIDVKMAERDKNSSGKAKVPFHVPTIKKPQEEYNILVNNANLPFEHVWLERSEDDLRAMHPLEKFSVLDFVDKDVNEMEPVKPLPLEQTPFKFVQEVKDLKELVAKLRSVEEFAVDLEHNQYRSFQGLTCLMQISTRTEDYIVDTFKLRIHIGPYLREIFKDPKKKKVMHGADRDIIWLQRDFGIYVCNLFDTGQASRVLNLERNSLEFLLQHFCGVTANKEYQNADWRIRPLPEEMTRYAREDTHYLLYIYDLIKLELQRMAKDDAHTDSPLLEVYKRSYDVCTQLYEKELLTENSYLHVYGLQAAGFNAAQLAIVAVGLCEWRDFIARAEDESTGYVLPNKVLLEIAKEMPDSVGKLRRMLKSKHPYIERNVDSVVSVIRQSMQHYAAFESAALSLKDVSPGNVMDKNIEPISEKKDLHTGDVASPSLKENSSQLESTRDLIMGAANTNEGRGLGSGLFGSAKVSAAVRISKKPSSGLGALLGNAASKKKSRTDEKVKEDVKLEQIRSSVNLSFHSFTEKVPDSKSTSETSPKVYGKPEEMSSTMPASVSKEDGVKELKDDSEEASEIVGTSGRVSESKVSSSEMGDIILLENGDEKKVDAEDEPMSLSELSTNFQKCFKSMNKSKKAQKQTEFLNIEPFDYEAARKEVKFGEGHKGRQGKREAAAGQKKGSTQEQSEFGQGKRRQAFPASGNRSMSFKN
ncbi:nucleolar protein-like [Arabidopsis thaliana]|nr:nucleolar protein-like [Arabidopsis thaliana]